MTNILISLIHNNDQKRLAHIRPKLEELRAALYWAGHRVLIIEPSFRPDLRQADLTTTIYQQYLYWSQERAWCEYRNIEPASSYLTDLTGFIFVTLPTLSSEEKRIRAFRDMIVPVNHAMGWKNGIDVDADYIMTFEDDVIFKPDSIERIPQLIDDLAHRINDKPVYIDLADGLNDDLLRLRKLNPVTIRGYTYYKKPVTNTACCYLIDRKMAQFFLETMNDQRNQRLKLLGADWLMNALFLELERQGRTALCMHGNPPVFVHGSMVKE